MIPTEEICIVVPCYNEGKRLPVADFEEYITHHVNVCFCFVDDGSVDDTSLVTGRLKERFPGRVETIRNMINSGKAESVRNGINYALDWKPFRYLGYFDADLATPLEEINHLHYYLNAHTRFEFALGSRILRLGSFVQRKAARHYVGRVFATLASLVLRLPVYDTQCGAKLINQEIAREIFKQPFISRWLFDVELIARVKQRFSVDLMVEVPVDTWIEKGDTRIKLKDFIRLPIDLFRISRAYPG